MSILGDGKCTKRLAILTKVLRVLKVEIKANKLVEGEFKNRFNDYSSARALGHTQEARMWQAFRAFFIELASKKGISKKKKANKRTSKKKTPLKKRKK